MDIVSKSWSEGNYFSTGKNDANPATHRTMKTFRPIRMVKDDTVRYLWSLANVDSTIDGPVEDLAYAAGRMYALGWGIDMIVGHGEGIDSNRLEEMPGECWKPSTSASDIALRNPCAGTLNALQNRYKSFLSRISSTGFTPVDPLTQFRAVSYRRVGDPLPRPSITFELRQDDGEFFQYPQRKLIHIAGMVRHLAIEAMDPKKGGSPPRDISDVDQWVDRYVAGHARDYPGEHRQFSYLPLPSIGHQHVDQAVRRVMITASVGDDRLLKHLALHLAGQQLKPTKQTRLDNPPTLIRVHRDKVAACYTRPANTWASVTPVILPGHNDHKPAKTVKLIEKALRQSGIEQPCTFEWRAVSWFSKSLTAHKYDRDKKPTGYIRPDHLLTQTAVHLKLTFNDGLTVPGPLVIGAGRHCGLGLMAASD